MIDHLEAEWAVFMEDRPGKRNSWTQDQRWRNDNPGELAALLAYRGGGPRPVLVTEPGRRMVHHVAAWLEAVTADPPPPALGWLLPKPLPESSGQITDVATLSQLNTAVATAKPGSRIRLNGTIAAGTQVDVTPRVPGTATDPITIEGAPGAKFIGRINIKAGFWRTRGFDIEADRYNCIKIGDGSTVTDIDIDRMRLFTSRGDTIESAVLSGNTATARVQVRNTLIDGSLTRTGANQGPHGIYTGGATSDWLIANCLIRDTFAYGLHFYPQINGARYVCCTIEGGRMRGGVITAFGAAQNIKGVGNIIQGAPEGAFTYNGETGCSADDTIVWDCRDGVNTVGFRPMPGKRIVVSDPAVAAPGFISEESYGWVPPFDMNGSPRVEATAGCVV